MIFFRPQPKKRMVEIIEGEKFIFCPKTYKLFKQIFCSPYSDIVVINGYLARIHRYSGYGWFFHRWYRLRTIRKNCMETYEVHHRNGNKRDNRGRNFIFLKREEQNEEHEKMIKRTKFKKAYETYQYKFLKHNPHASFNQMYYFWCKFKERNNISKV